MELLIIGIYFLAMTLITIFSLVQLDLAIRYLRKRKHRSRESDQVPLKTYPLVTVQIPVYNEKYVIERLIRAVAGFNYPKDRMEIHVLDDSTDDTTRILHRLREELAGQGYRMEVFHRDSRTGYKAGALQEGLQRANGELIAIFDADFIPGEDFLLKTIPCFEDPGIGMVQTRWGHINEDYSLLTRLQAFGLNAHFSVEQSGRLAAGSFINFNGTGGVWRKRCIGESGGWAPGILSEDLDLSYRAQMKGWKFRYLEDVIAPAELPVLVTAIRSQQFRWSKGGAQSARKNLPGVFRSRIGFRNKIHAVFHLMNSAIFPLLLLAAICSIPLLYIKENNPVYQTLFHIGTVFVLGFIGISIFYWIASRQHHPGHPVKYFLINFPLFLSMTMGLSFQNSIAVIEGLSGISSPFVRTPKFNIASSKDTLKDKAYREIALSWKQFFEFLLFLYFAFGVATAFFLQDFGLMIFHLMLAGGFAGLVFFTLKSLFHDDSK